MYEKVALFCMFYITGQTKLKFLLRLLLIFPSHEELQSSEVVNKLKICHWFFWACRGFGMHSETTTFSQTNYRCYHTDLATILFYISLWLSQFLHKLDSWSLHYTKRSSVSFKIDERHWTTMPGKCFSE